MDILKFLEIQSEKKAVGTMTLGKRKGFREVFLEGDLAYIVGERFSGKVSTGGLRALGIPGERMSLEKLDALILATDRTRILLPRALHEQGHISEEEMAACAEDSVAEEIHELLFLNQGSFQFQEGRVPEHLLRSEEISARTPVRIEAILAELRRRDRIAPELDVILPSREEVFVLTEKGLQLRAAEKLDYFLQRTTDLIDGLRSLDAILKDSYFHEFHILEWVASALEDGSVKKTVLPELKGLSTHTLGKEDAERYLPFFRNAVRHAADELAARERLAVVYEKLGKRHEAVIQYNFIGDALYRMKQAPKAIKAYHRALQIQPGEILLTDKITKIYREAAAGEIAAGNLAQAVQLYKGALGLRPEDHESFTQTVRLLVRENKLKELAVVFDWVAAHARKTDSPSLAINACREIIRELPDASGFKKRLINLYLDFGLTEEALSEMQVLAGEYTDRGQVAPAQDLLEKIRRIAPPTPDTKRLERLLAGKQRAAAGSGAAPRLFLVFAALFFTYQLLALVSWKGLRGHPGVAVASSGAEETAGSLTPAYEDARCTTIASRATEFLRRYPLSVLRSDAEHLRLLAWRRLGELEATRAASKRKIIDEARLALNEGDRPAVEAILQPILSLSRSDELMEEAEALVLAALACPKSAAAMLRHARDLEEKGDWRGAHRAYHELMETYPLSSIVPGLRLPVLIETVPPGAEVRDVSRPDENRVLGTAPLVVSLAPGEMIPVEMTAPGSSKLETEVLEADGRDRLFLLAKEPLWAAALDGAIEVRPVFAGGRVLCATAHGTIACLDAATGRMVWRRAGSAIEGLASPPVLTEDGLFTLWKNGKLLRMPLPLTRAGMEGEPEPPPDVTAEVFLGSLATSPLHACRGRASLAAGTRSGLLQVYVTSTASLAWSCRIDGVITRIADLDEDLLVSTADGSLARVRQGEPGPLWKRAVSTAGITSAFQAGKAVVAATGRGEIVFLRADDGVPVHVVTPPDGSLARLGLADGKAFVLDGAGELAAIAADPPGEVLRTRKLPFGPSSLIPLPGAIAILHDGEKGVVIVDSASLSPLWAARLRRPITHVAANDRWVAVVTEGGRLAVYSR